MMNPLDIIKTLINEIDPNNELNDTVNVGLAVVVNDKYHKLTLVDLRQCVTESADSVESDICDRCGYPKDTHPRTTCWGEEG